MMDTRAPLLRIEGGVATITLCRVAEHNRIDPDDTQVVMSHLEEIDRTPGVAAVVITGEGTKTFCSGYTLGRISTRLDRSFEDMLDGIETVRVPTICALNGSAYGGGTDIAISCDFRIGIHGSRIFMPAAKFGLHYYPGGLRRFVTRIGPVATKKIFLTAQSLKAEELLRIGYLTDLVAPEALQEKVQAYVDAILQCEAGAVASMKQQIDELARGTWSEKMGRAAYEESLRSPAVAARLAGLGSPARSPEKARHVLE